MTFKSFGKLMIPLCLAAPPPATAAPFACPASLDIAGAPHALTSADVFDGPPAERASLVPVNGVWDTKPADSTTGKLYLVCAYAGTPQQTTIPLPAQVTSCALGGTQNKPEISCH